MRTTIRKPVLSTRQRLLDAAARVFAQKGLEGATTREIAQQAEVNEVTLFRHFQTKEKLVGAVLKLAFERPVELPSAEEGLTGASRDLLPSTGGLREDLERFARRYDELLQRNILLIRTLLGEIHRHREHEASVLHGIFAPLKAELVTAIQTARSGGAVRPEIEPVIAADLFSSMVFLHTLRRTGLSVPDYSTEQYLGHVVEIFVRGVEP